MSAAPAGHGVPRVTASYTRAAVAAGQLRRLLPDHACEPLPRAARAAICPGYVRVSSMRWKQHARGDPEAYIAIARTCHARDDVRGNRSTPVNLR